MDDTAKVMTRRVYDIAGLFGDETTVFLNGKKISLGTSKVMGSFEKYANLYIGKSNRNKKSIFKL